MTKRLIVLIAATTLAACATRQGPPAPVVTAGQPQPGPAETAPAPAAPKKAAPRPVQVYAYRPPSEAARIPEEAEMAVAEAEAVDAAVEPQPESIPKPARPPEAAPPPAAPAVAAQPTQTKPPADVQAPPVAPPAPEAAAIAAADQGGQATPADALRAQAERQRQAGDYAGAAATLERGLRIQPQDARLWNRLARVRMEQGLHSQAANLAARSNALAGDQADLKRDNWSIIATARRQAGDTAGAAEAERKARGA
jgi:tetratricopeptide (TPR) repeat protein